ncbi:MAG: hypothetical protein OCD00_05450 [Colwellia sp.]
MPEKNSIVQIGGSVERALQGDYHIDVKAILTEAWQLTLKSRVAINLGLLFVLSLYILITLVLSNYIPFMKDIITNPEIIFTNPELMQANGDKILFWDLLVTLAIWPFIAGIEMMGVVQAVGMKANAKMIFSFLKRSSWVVICVLITSMLINIGFELLILPGIFLKVTLSLTVPLVIEKQMTPMKAILLSIKVFRFKFFSILSLYIILFLSLILLIFMLSFFVSLNVAPIGGVFFIFGITHLAPLFYNTKGILYREIFGINIATDKTAEELTQTMNSSTSKTKSDSDDTFSA